jgi:hypothetical protein
MPEQPPSNRKRPLHPLSVADQIGQIARVSCQFCRITRHYSPGDLVQLIGDVGIDRVQHRMRCEKCGRSDYLVARLILPTELERQSIKLRRLDKVWWVKKVSWRDE